jgi:uncharacterized protein (DUF1697 family)
LAAAIEGKFRLVVPVLVRSIGDWERVVRENPFLEHDSDESKLHVAFLGRTPSKREVEALDPGRSPPDEFVVRGSEIYLRLPGGVARTKLDTRYFDRALGTTSTFRNWRTVLRLRDIARKTGV